MSEKTYVFGDTSNNGMLSLLGPLMQQRGIDPNVLLAMRNNDGFGGEGGWFIWILFLAMMWGGFGGGYGGFGGRGGYLANEFNNDFGRSWLLQAIDGNGDAIQQLATTLHCDVNQINTTLNALQGQIQSVGNQVGLSGQQIINAIQSGNCQLASQLASCCCDIKTGMERGFSSIAFETQRQTCDIEKAIAGSTSAITARLDAMEKTSLLDKIDKLREDKSTLTTQLNLEHQNAYTAGVISQAISPVNAALTDLSKRLADIECKQPPTISLPYVPAMGSVIPVNYSVPVNFSASYGYGNYGCGC